MSRSRTVLTLAAMVVAGQASAAEADCTGMTPDAAQAIALARVETTEPRVNFIANPGVRTPACPSLASACRLKAFLVAGDEVLIAPREGPFVCATFKAPRGTETSGWLPRAALSLQHDQQTSAAAWDGAWRRDGEAEIVLRSRGEEVEVSGQATYGGGDPDRVRRGAVNTGELAGKAKPRGEVLAIGYDPDRSGFPPPPDCAARLRLLGRYLAVEDNGACGGVNVSFTGIYVRAGGR